MAEFKKVVITKKGQSLMAKLMSGTGTVEFTRIAVSSTTYTDAQLEVLTSLSSIKQSAPVSKVLRTNDVAVQVEGAITNTDITTGYYMQTLGLYALDPQDGEILYAVTNASVAGYMPPFNGRTPSGAFFKLVTTIGNADNVNLQVDPAAVATVGDIQDLQSQLNNIQSYIGYEDENIVGIEADFETKKVTRLAGATNRTAGQSFDDIATFGNRRRCILTDGGKVLAYHGQTGYTENGALTQAIINGEITYPVGTKVQVMVEQPKFYYKVVPLKLDKVIGGKGFHLRKARYYVSDEQKLGFKIHPAFIHNGKVKNNIYLSAYEGSIYDVSTNSHILDDAQIADFATDKLASISGTKPASGLTQNLTRANTRKLANNRGIGWNQSYGATVAATQLLFSIEYASFNTQEKIGLGVSKTDDGVTNMGEPTGATTLLGNKSGKTDNGSITYRGEENFWMNLWMFVDGLNIEAKGLHNLYVADHDFVDDVGTAPYKDAGITIAKTNGYISAFAYNEEFDWLFFPSETTGNSSVPVGDYLYQNNTANSWYIARFGGYWADVLGGGSFFWRVYNVASDRYRDIGGRLVYVPGVA